MEKAGESKIQKSTEERTEQEIGSKTKARAIAEDKKGEKEVLTGI